MRKIFTVILSAAFVTTSFFSFGQDEKKDYKMVELTFMHAKHGKSDEFTKAVKAHDQKYHPAGPHQAALYSINTGEDAGTFVWVMGPCMMKDLDNRPGVGAHDDDWKKNVEPYIESYGAVEYWKQNEALSFMPENMTPQKVNIFWIMDIKRGEYYRFKKMMADIQAVHKDNGTTNVTIWDNKFYENNGRDVALQWHKADFASLDSDFNMKKEYEKMYGEGTWQQVLEEWEEVVVDMKAQMWTKVN